MWKIQIKLLSYFRSRERGWERKGWSFTYKPFRSMCEWILAQLHFSTEVLLLYRRCWHPRSHVKCWGKYWILGISIVLYFIFHFNFVYHTNKAPSKAYKVVHLVTVAPLVAYVLEVPIHVQGHIINLRNIAVHVLGLSKIFLYISYIVIYCCVVIFAKCSIKTCNAYFI